MALYPLDTPPFFMAPEVGFEPTANWLTANCSTTELPGIVMVANWLIPTCRDSTIDSLRFMVVNWLIPTCRDSTVELPRRVVV